MLHYQYIQMSYIYIYIYSVNLQKTFFRVVMLYNNQLYSISIKGP